MTIDTKNGPGMDDVEEWYTPQEVGKRLKLDPRTVVRQFHGLPGVIEFGSDERLHKRKRTFHRMSNSALKRFEAERQTRK